MKLKLKNNWFITSDTNNFIITEYGITKNGDESVTNHAYFNTLEGALKSYYNRIAVKEIVASNIVDFITEYKKLKRDFEEHIEKLKVGKK